MKDKCKCENCDCGKDEKIRVYFCPKCKSRNVKYIFELGNVFGVIPRMRCMECRTEMPSFPILEIKKSELIKKSKSKKKSVKSESGGKKK